MQSRHRPKPKRRAGHRRRGSLHLRFRFPDTDAFADGPDDDRTLTGPVTIAVTAPTRRCRASSPARRAAQQGGLLACVDTLYRHRRHLWRRRRPSYSLRTSPRCRRRTTTRRCAATRPACTGRAAELRFTVDADGQPARPRCDWAGVLVGQRCSIARLRARQHESSPPSPAATHRCAFPGNAFLHSYSPEGAPAAAGLRAASRSDRGRRARRCSAPPMRRAACCGSTAAARRSSRARRRRTTELPCNDAAATVPREPARRDLRRWLARRSACAATASAPGASAARRCSTSARACTPASARCRASGGTRRTRASTPACAARPTPTAAPAPPARPIRFAAENPVPLDGLYETPGLLVSVVPEAFAGKDLNGDGDQTRRRPAAHRPRTGAQRCRSARARRPRPRRDAGAPTPPFSFPAASRGDDVVAFLEPEPLQGDADLNGDGDSFDAIVRVFRHGEAATEELTAGLNLAVDAAPLINDRSLAVSDGRSFFRRARGRRLRGGDSSGSASASDGTAATDVDPPGRSPRTAARRVRQHGHQPGSASRHECRGVGQSAASSTTCDTRRPCACTSSRSRCPPERTVLTPWPSGNGRYVAWRCATTTAMSRSTSSTAMQTATASSTSPGHVCSGADEHQESSVTPWDCTSATAIRACRPDTRWPNSPSSSRRPAAWRRLLGVHRIDHRFLAMRDRDVGR